MVINVMKGKIGNKSRVAGTKTERDIPRIAAAMTREIATAYSTYGNANENGSADALHAYIHTHTYIYIYIYIYLLISIISVSLSLKYHHHFLEKLQYM